MDRSIRRSFLSVASGVLLLSVGATFVRAATMTHQVTLGNSVPVVSGVSLNHGNPITLTANSTTTVEMNFTISDDNGCSDVFSSGTLSVYVYRSGMGSSTASSSSSTLHSYWGSVATTSCTAGNVAGSATATVDIWYFAQATDASSSYPSETWIATVFAADASSSTSTADSAGVELSTLLAIEAASSSLSYGTVGAGATTTGNYPATIVNAGNSSTTLTVFGTALTSGSNGIPTSSQHYATATFTFGEGEQQLSGTANSISGLTIARPPFTSWEDTTALPNAIRYQLAAASPEGYLYSVGGIDQGGNATSTALFAPLNATGSVGAWTETTPLPSAAMIAGTVLNDGYIYGVGGQTVGNTVTSTVRFAPVNTDGTLGAWTNTTDLPSATTQAQSFVYNGFIYIIGGGDASQSPTTTVRFAPVNTDGTLGAWTNTTALPSPLRLHGAALVDGYVFAGGGLTTGGARTSTVWSAPLNATGSVGAWTETTPLPYAVNGHRASSDGTTLYVVGGSTASGNTSTVLFAKASGGSLSPWSTTTPLSQQLTNGGNVIRNGYLYYFGGEGFVVTAGVRFAPLASRNTYWGLQVPGGMPIGTYTGITTLTAVFVP